MEETYTIEDALVQFMYHEMPAQEVAHMAQCLEEDPELRDAYGALLTAKNQLPKVQFNPSSKALQNIMDYSAKTALETQC
ncbi:MAG TPA: hypothetical protein PK971_06695 [Saprospiraceae bacterium]|nr:hypothetical protein [Saprospiraceae bacterium]HND87994.1 hypothetical protein [Saprospiraceae bacterium]